MLFRRIVEASKTVSLSTALSTASLDVKIKAILSSNDSTNAQKKIPINKDVTTDTIVANLAA
jgi:hypothetical protein